MAGWLLDRDARLSPQNCTTGYIASGRLLPVPSDRLPSSPHLPLQLEHAVQQGLGSGWAAGYVEVDGDNTVTSSNDRV